MSTQITCTKVVAGHKVNKTRLLLTLITIITLIGLGADPSAFGQANENNPDDPQTVLDQFRQAWGDGHWTKNFRSWDGYMWASDDDSWQARMIALQNLVAGGEHSVDALHQTLESSNHAPTRILAAQTLSYLAPHADIDALLAAAKGDDDPAVRLYAVDALGMSGRGGQIDWGELEKNEKNRDIKSHIRYARSRGNEPIDPDIVQKLVDWDPQKIDSAKVGEKAPDFHLTTVDGESIRLSDFRGKHEVVLVFIYGDT